MIDLRETEEFSEWVQSLADARAKAKILGRIGRLRMGNPGDVGPVGEGISEMRIHHGPGYRVYFKQRGTKIIVLLCGGAKSTQRDDIARAKRLADEYQE